MSLSGAETPEATLWTDLILATTWRLDELDLHGSM